jgi:hypothetical protein
MSLKRRVTTGAGQPLLAKEKTPAKGSPKRSSPAKSSREKGKQEAQSYFTPEGLRFLRGLARNNNRDWFNARKPVYEAQIKRPMLAVIEAVTGAMMDFAPGHVRAPESIMMRIMCRRGGCMTGWPRPPVRGFICMFPASRWRLPPAHSCRRPYNCLLFAAF